MMNLFAPLVFIIRWKQFLQNTSVHHVMTFVVDQVSLNARKDNGHQQWRYMNLILRARNNFFSLLPPGSKAVQHDWQVVDEDHDTGPRDPQRGAVLCGRRDPDAAAAPPPGAARAVSEIPHWVGGCVAYINGLPGPMLKFAIMDAGG